jgi:hypothetical protein
MHDLRHTTALRMSRDDALNLRGSDRRRSRLHAAFALLSSHPGTEGRASATAGTEEGEKQAAPEPVAGDDQQAPPAVPGTVTGPWRPGEDARLVLARCGRPAEALAQYETIRARLADELGVDPGLELRRVHADLLAGVDPPLDQPASASAVPPQLSTFVGRVCELKRAGADVTALSGMAASARPPWCCTRRIRW